jgi:hypothetical protein
MTEPLRRFPPSWTVTDTMATLSNEQLRALHILAHTPGGCTEAKLLEQGFTVGQLSSLVYAGLATLRRKGPTMALWVKITKAGRKAIAE